MQSKLSAALQQNTKLRDALQRASAAGQAARNDAARLREEAHAAKQVSQKWCLQLNNAQEQLSAARDAAQSLQTAQTNAVLPHQGVVHHCLSNLS
jgi:molecular chaperone GrpE (heat shock protein)